MNLCVIWPKGQLGTFQLKYSSKLYIPVSLFGNVIKCDVINLAKWVRTR